MARLTPTFVRVLVPVVVVVAVVAPASASEGGDGDAVMKFVWEVLNFALLIAAIVYFARKPIV